MTTGRMELSLTETGKALSEAGLSRLSLICLLWFSR